MTNGNPSTGATVPFRIAGAGVQLGSDTVSNADVSKWLGKESTWLTDRTGIESRRMCAEGENACTLAADAIRAAIADAGLTTAALGPETVLIHIQNGPVNLTPPSGVTVGALLGLGPVRILALDGVCAEPIAALDVALSLLEVGRCERAVISASAAFMPAISPIDPGTAGLFGAGAGAIVIDREEGDLACRLMGMRWETHSRYAGLGVIPIEDCEVSAAGMTLRTGFYEMDGVGLVRSAFGLLPSMVDELLAATGCRRDDIELVIAHQPNAKMLELGARVLGFDPLRVPMPVRTLGNLGPASILVTLADRIHDGGLQSGQRVLLLAFGLGLSLGLALIELA
jgi:3-oxoacyl-[acyl-carrier-protein] synthase-3